MSTDNNLRYKVLVKFKKLRKDAKIPHYKHDGDSGLDLFSNENVVLNPRNNQLISTGLAIQLPYGYEGQVRSKSGLAIHNNIRVFGGIGTIDSNYRGEILVHLENVSFRSYEIRKGFKIAQLVIVPVSLVEYVLVDELDRNSSRNEEGFSSDISKELGIHSYCSYCSLEFRNSTDVLIGTDCLTCNKGTIVRK